MYIHLVYGWHVCFLEGIVVDLPRSSPQRSADATTDAWSSLWGGTERIWEELPSSFQCFHLRGGITMDHRDIPGITSGWWGRDPCWLFLPSYGRIEGWIKSGARWPSLYVFFSEKVWVDALHSRYNIRSPPQKNSVVYQEAFCNRR